MPLHPYYHQLPPLPARLPPQQWLFDRFSAAPVQQPDFQFPNVALAASTVAVGLPPGQHVADVVPAPAPKQFDFQFPNIPVLAVAQLQVHPVGEAIDETIPAPQAKQPDFPFPDVALFVSKVVPVGKAIDETVPQPPPHQLDFAFPNVALYAFAQLQVHPIGAAIDETVPQPPPHQLDFAFPNIALPQSAAPQKPVGGVVDETRPRIDPHQYDFQFPNIPALAVAQLQVHPVGSAIDETVPAPQAKPVDFRFSNLLTTVVAKPPVGQLLIDRPSPQQQPADIGPPNIPALTAAQLQVKPVGQQGGLFDRPVTVVIPFDEPLPNILITTLSVVVIKPRNNYNFLFDPSPPSAIVHQDVGPPNIALLNFRQLQIKPIGGMAGFDRPRPPLPFTADYYWSRYPVIPPFVPPVVGASYRLLSSHYLYGIYYTPNTIVTEGREIPFGWVPTLAVDPLNAQAATAYYNAGPRNTTYDALNTYDTMYRRDYGDIPVNSPATYWKQVPGTGMYQLTGLGVGNPPIGGG